MGPTTYDIGDMWARGDRQSSQFMTKLPRLHPSPAPVSDTDDFFLPSSEASHAPLSRGLIWPRSPRDPSVAPRDSGSEQLSDPHARSLSAQVEASSRLYRNCFHSKHDRWKICSATKLGPGEYDLARTSAIRVARPGATKKPSPCFRQHTHSKAAKRGSTPTLTQRAAEPFGGDWVRAGTIDRHWTSKRTVIYY